MFNALKLDKIAKSVSWLMIACFQVTEQNVYRLLIPSFCHWQQRYYCHCQTFLSSKLTVWLWQNFSVTAYYRASNCSMSLPTALCHWLVSVLSYWGCTSYLLPTPMFLSLSSYTSVTDSSIFFWFIEKIRCII